MLTQTLRTIFRRDLEQLKKEIDLYEREDRIWCVDKNIANSAGNLCLHLIGNLNAFVGTELGHTGYVRDRPWSFRPKMFRKASCWLWLTKRLLS